MSNLNSPLQRINQYDVALCVFCNRQSRNLFIRRFFRLISRLGDGVFWYTLMCILLVIFQEAALPAVLHMLLAALVGTVSYKLIKGKTLRPRPFNVYPAIICTGKTLDQFSFPSGHTLHAVSFSLIAVFYFPALVWLVLPFSLLVAVSRPVLGLHYPSDVLAGAALGALIAIASIQLV
jgi:undecaprenyl-diphosphatase